MPKLGSKEENVQNHRSGKGQSREVYKFLPTEINDSVSGHRDSVSAGASASCGLFSSTAHTCVECVRALSLRTPLHHSGGLLARHPFPLSPEQLAPSWQSAPGAPLCLFDSLCQQSSLLPNDHPKHLTPPICSVGYSVNGPPLKLGPFTRALSE